jgi:hypothetical protein
VAFVCAGGFCPSCFGRQMAQGAANWVDHIIPNDVPLRQLVLTVPFELRARLAFDRDLVGRLFVDTVLRWYERTFRARGVASGQSRAITVVQRVGLGFPTQPHYHAIFLNVDLDALSLLCRLAASLPPPRMHVARFAGVLSAAHKWRSRVVPPPPAEDASDETHACGKSERPATHRSGYWSWAKLLKRSLGIDADKCQSAARG